MASRPILFNAQMVRAILGSHKSQTRRIVKPQPKGEVHWSAITAFGHGLIAGHGFFQDANGTRLTCPYGVPGDDLWVRETWQHETYPHGPYQPGNAIHYRADYLDDPLGADLERSPDGIRRRWIPSIHMPRSASRITLRVTHVTIQRVQGISPSDAIGEGVTRPESNDELSAVDAFRELWLSINGPGSWEANPWVWAVCFERVKP